MKARTKFEKQVATSNVRLTAVAPKVFEWGVRNLSGFRAVEPLAEIAVISSYIREKANM